MTSKAGLTKEVRVVFHEGGLSNKVLLYSLSAVYSDSEFLIELSWTHARCIIIPIYSM